MARARALRIADLGTGSGAILLALLHELPDAFGVGTDISLGRASDRALQCLRSRARLARGFVACDYAMRARPASFDLIVSNPPYIRSADIAGLATEVRDHDPRARWMAARTGSTPIAG